MVFKIIEDHCMNSKNIMQGPASFRTLRIIIMEILIDPSIAIFEDSLQR